MENTEMRLTRYPLCAGAPAILALSLVATSANAMPAYDDNTDKWPMKLKEVANPHKASTVINRNQLQSSKKKPGVDQEPTYPVRLQVFKRRR